MPIYNDNWRVLFKGLPIYCLVFYEYSEYDIQNATRCSICMLINNKHVHILNGMPHSLSLCPSITAISDRQSAKKAKGVENSFPFNILPPFKGEFQWLWPGLLCLDWGYFLSRGITVGCGCKLSCDLRVPQPSTEVFYTLPSGCDTSATCCRDLFS